MRYIFLQLCIVCLALTTQAQETRTPRMTPMRTNDPALRQMVVTPVLPLKSGDNARQQKTEKTVAVPLKSGGGNAAQQQKAQQTAEVPIRKVDGAAAGSSAGSGAQDKAAQTDKTAKTDKPAVVLPSSLSAKEAKEQQQQPKQ